MFVRPKPLLFMFESSPHTVTNISSFALLICKALQAHGIEPQRLMAQAGIDPGAIEQADSRLDRQQVIALWHCARELTQDPYIGLKAASFSTPTSFSALGLAMAASKNGLDALQRLVRFSQVISNGSVASLDQKDGLVCVTHHHIVNVAEQKYFHGIECIFAMSLQALRSISSHELSPTEVHFEHNIEVDLAPFKQVFNCPVYPGSQNAMAFKLDDLLSPHVFANSQLADTLDSWIEDNLTQTEHDLLSIRVKKYLLKNIPYGVIEQKQVAKELALSPRILQRLLKKEETTYSAILDECRQKIACKLLTKNATPIIEIAFLLGFSDQSNFSRAFKLWTGKTPKQFRGL